jgi:hypothetical protein
MTMTLDDFYVVTYVPWDNIEKVMGKEKYKRFAEWMYGQTTAMEGVYPWDLERFLKYDSNN